MGFVGAAVVIICVFGGYMLGGGHLSMVWQPLEILIIFGAAAGGYITANPMKTIKAGIRLAIKSMSSKGPTKKEYLDLLQMMFQIFQIFRKDGPQAVEKHIEDPHQSAIFNAYPSFMKNHHAVDFLTDTMKITLSADLTQYDVDDLLDTDIKAIHAEEHAAQHAVSQISDAFPGLGIVAAVLGIVHTMAYLTAGVEKIGSLVAAALIGTFLGVLSAYGFVAPIATKMANDITNEGRYLEVIKAALVALQKGAPPLVCVEYARRTVFPEERPSFSELDQATKDIKKQGGG